MKHCPTCGQIILPSMGEMVANKVKKVNQQRIRTPNTKPVAKENNVSLTFSVNNSTFSPKVETTPNGYKAHHLYTSKGKYRLRFQFIYNPNKKIIGGRITVITLGDEKKVTVYGLEEQLTIYPNSPFSHEWDKVIIDLDDRVNCLIILKTV